MKQKRKARSLFAVLLVTLLLMALLPLPAYADIYDGDGYYFDTDIGLLIIRTDSGSTGWRIANNNPGQIVTLLVEEGVTELSASAFMGATIATSVALPDSLQIINGYVFNRCSALTSITIPPNVTSIGKEAFGDCGALTTLTFRGQTAPSLEADAFKNCGALTTINVPYGATGYDSGIWLNYTIVYGDPPAPVDNGVPHVCDFGGWQYSNEHHWKRCSCTALSDYAPHVFNSARVCTVCGYGAKSKKVNPPTGVYDSSLPRFA